MTTPLLAIKSRPNNAPVIAYMATPVTSRWAPTTKEKILPAEWPFSTRTIATNEKMLVTASETPKAYIVGARLSDCDAFNPSCEIRASTVVIILTPTATSKAPFKPSKQATMYLYTCIFRFFN